MKLEDVQKTFSEAGAFESMAQDAMYKKILRETSVSDEDAASRNKVYSEVMQNYENMKEVYKTFSGYAEIPILSNQYFNASMASYVRSFAGYLSIERSCDQPTSLLWFNDLLGVVDNRKVLPNLGQENLEGINARFMTQSPFVEGQTEYTISTNKKLIPGSVELQFIHAAEPNKVIVVKDDRKGNLLAPPGVLANNADGSISVKYETGVIKFTVGDGFVIAENDMFAVKGQEDIAGDPAFGQLTGPGNNRFKIDMKNIIVHTEPDMLVGENNLMAIAASQKSIGMNPQEVTGQKLTELYTKLVNNKLTKAIVDNDMGNEVTIPMDKYFTQFTDFNSRLDAFQSDLVDVDTALAKKTIKATKATCYLVGLELGNWFRKLRTTGNWTENTESTYINDLLGFFNGIPVLRHNSIDPYTGYAVHKTPGGELAPVMRGIFLPLTNTPLIGNYNNPSQYANGVYYQESNESILPELTQKFVLKVK